jgi:mannose/fructose-specific phosphotransferase system component IIA
MVNAVRGISGCDQDALLPLSNEGKSPDALRDELAELMGQGPGVIFTDLQTGSCALVARLVSGRFDGVGVICGANLPMLLDFVFHRDLPLEQLLDRLVRKGQEAVRSLLEEPGRADPPLSG